MKRAFLVCLILLAVLNAHALAMGPSPDSSFAGTWRIVEAGPVPWIKPHTLSREEAPLLEFAIAFRDGEAVGAPQSARKHAGYESGRVSIEELFPGKAPEGKEEEPAHAIDLSSSAPHMLRVDGDAGTLFASESGSHVFEQGDTVHTMERPKQEVEPGHSGPSFDCTKAHTAGEKAICLNEDLSKFDLQMGTAFSRLSKTETPESFATVRSAQRAWLAFTMKFCGANGPLQPELSPDKDIESCLNESYLYRAGVFDDAKVLREGSLRLEPRMRFFSRAKPAAQESVCYPWVVGGPRAAAFNTYIAAILMLDRRSIDAKEFFSNGQDLPEKMLLESRRDFRVKRFDTRIASLQVWSYDYVGGNQGTADAFTVNWDIERKKPVTLGDIFFTGKKWEDFVISYCKEDLENQEEWREEEADRSMVKRVVTDGRNWLFDRDKAIVRFPAGNIVVTGRGEFEVEIPYDELKPFMRPNTPVR